MSSETRREVLGALATAIGDEAKAARRAEDAAQAFSAARAVAAREYGGSLENRMRFPLQVLERVSKAVGRDFTVGIRLCVDEKFWGGISPEESTRVAQSFERTGHCDFINVSLGTYYNLHLVLASMHTPYGFTIDLAEKLKRAVNIPIIASHQIAFPQMAEDMVLKGQADAIGLVKSLISDPDAPRKAREGRIQDIVFCVKDNKGCIGRINQTKTLSCMQNPEVGYEQVEREGEHAPAVVKKKVLVVGGGPAGMEAARVAKARGHDVTLYEKAAVLGGQINLIRTLEVLNKHKVQNSKITVQTGLYADS